MAFGGSLQTHNTEEAVLLARGYRLPLFYGYDTTYEK